ncbi:MAG: substrate-binding domain-containing protein, partial [Tateyamaria sp.]
ARAINSGRSHIVGALVPTLDNSIFARFLVGLETQLDTFGLSLIVASTGDDPGVELDKARALVDIGAEGLILTGITHADELHALLNRFELPTIAISYHDPNCVLPTVGYDNAAATRVGLEHLRGLGHARIAILHGPTQHNDRTRARVETIKQSTGATRHAFYEGPISIETGRDLARHALNDDFGCTAMLCFSDVLALGALFELQEQGVSVPDQMSLMGMENLPSSEHAPIPLTTVDLQVADMGVQAANALGQWVSQDQRPDHTCLHASLVQRQTTGPAPGT